MGHLARLRARLPARPSPGAAWAASGIAAFAVLLLMLMPRGPAAMRLVSRMATLARTISRHAPVAPPTLLHGRLVGGVRPVGALFGYSGGALHSHFCTASVVDSKTKDLLITAAHCVAKLRPGDLAFVPDFNGARKVPDPYGIWTVTKIVVDSAWQHTQNPNRDVAFLVVQQAGTTSGIQDVTGGEKLAIGWGQRIYVHVVGYPDTHDRPIVCANRTRRPHLPTQFAALDRTQLEFDCGGYTNGTSGGPFLADYNSKTGEGTVIGVIGGYQEGGDIASVSYSPRFRRAVRALYRTAVSEG